jgi:CRISPR-associated protein Cas8a1/Csx13
MGGSLEVGLHDPGMTTLHRAGLAGLWMTLERAEGDPAARTLRELGGWRLDRDSVRLEWRDEGFFPSLFHYAYPITPGGLMSLALLGDPEARRAEVCAFHQGLLDTFLQHPTSRKLGGPARNEVFEVEGQQQPISYRPIADHRFRWEGFSPERPQPVAGWLLPGGVVRHYVHAGPTALEEPPGRALALRFGPAGCGYFLVHQRRREGIRTYRTAVVVPEVDDLERYARHARGWSPVGLEELSTAGPAEAALRFLVLRAADERGDLMGVAGCQVLGFTTLPWSPQQRVRAYVLSTREADREQLRRYGRIRRYLAPQVRRRADGDSWLDVPQVPELAAGNLLHRRPWWHGFATWTADPRLRQHVIGFESRGLNRMLNDETVTPEAEARIFVQACHEAWRNRLGQLSERARHQGLSFESLAQGERDRLRAALARCKTQADFSACVTDLWARAGSVPTLQRSWTRVLPFLGQRWREGRDLALLALASYRGEPSDDAGAAETSATQTSRGV